MTKDNESSRDLPAAQPVSSDDDNGDRIIDGLRFPREERQIDQLGFETTKHSLRFRGPDWDTCLVGHRPELTKAFIADASETTEEPEENIQNIRFVMSEAYLFCKFTVRHKLFITQHETQQSLAACAWRRVKKLYRPRIQKSKADGEKLRRAETEKLTDGESNAMSKQRINNAEDNNISFFGRHNVGPDGPRFEDKIDEDEEPVAYEEQVEAKRQNSRLIATVGLV